MKTKVNVIKIREEFRPFAGSILQDYVHEYFKVPEIKYSSPYMNYCFIVKPEKRKELAAIVHADNTCRIQTVAPFARPSFPRRRESSIKFTTDSDLYFKLIAEFHKLSGIPCVLDTSFNLKGEPIVESPKQAVKDFMKTRIDLLYIGSFIVYRE